MFYFNLASLKVCWLQQQTSVKEDKHKKEAVLIAVNRNHPDYTSFKPEKRQVEKKEQPTDHAANDAQRSNKLLEVSEIYKPSVHVNPIFAAVGADNRKLYSASEATEIVFSYIEKQNLVKPANKSIVVLDAILCDALYKGAIKKGTMYPTEIHKKDVGHTFINRMQPHHVVTRGSESVVRKGALKTIQIMTERRQGNKKVTRFSGLESFLIDPEALASELQKKFASSTTVAELPGIHSQILVLTRISFEFYHILSFFFFSPFLRAKNLPSCYVLLFWYARSIPYKILMKNKSKIFISF